MRPRCTPVCGDTHSGREGPCPRALPSRLPWEKRCLCPRGLGNTSNQGKVQAGDGFPGWGTPTAAPKPWCQTLRASLRLSEDALHRAVLLKRPCKAADAAVLHCWKKGRKMLPHCRQTSACSCAEHDPTQVSLRAHVLRASHFPLQQQLGTYGVPGSCCCHSSVPPAPATSRERGDRHHRRPGCSAAKQLVQRHRSVH